MGFSVKCYLAFFFQIFKVKICKIFMFRVLKKLRACPCKNRPLKFSWKMDCLHFFSTQIKQHMQ